MASFSLRILCFLPSIVTSSPAYFPKITRSPFLTSMGWTLPDSKTFPEPTATTFPSVFSSLAVSGRIIPPFVFSSASKTSTRILSPRGLILLIVHSPSYILFVFVLMNFCQERGCPAPAFSAFNTFHRPYRPFLPYRQEAWPAPLFHLR